MRGAQDHHLINVESLHCCMCLFQDAFFRIHRLTADISFGLLYASFMIQGTVWSSKTHK